MYQRTKISRLCAITCSCTNVPHGAITILHYTRGPTNTSRYLVAFADPADAVCFALAVQDRLNDIVWPSHVLEMRGCEPVYSNRRVGRKLYAGLSAGCIVLCAEV